VVNLWELKTHNEHRLMPEILGEPVGYNLHANVAAIYSNVVKGGATFGDVSTENKYTTRTVWWRKGTWGGVSGMEVHQVTRHPREVSGRSGLSRKHTLWAFEHPFLAVGMHNDTLSHAA